MKISYDPSRDIILVEGTGAVWPARSLVATSDADGISIMLPDAVTRVLGPLTPAQVEQPLADGTIRTFADVPSAMAYLAAQFAMRSGRVFQETLMIETQNTIPVLTHAWASGPGAFANIIIGAATFVSGAGVVAFDDGSQAVTYDPNAAGFNLDPGDRVIAQYSII